LGLYAAVSYLLFLASLLYTIAFLGDLSVPKTIDGPPGSLTGVAAIAVDALVLGLFAIQHSVMARPAFKRWWTQFIPNAAERSTSVLLSPLRLLLFFVAWQPVRARIWDLRGTAGGSVLSALRWIGWVVLLLATFMISHFELFGLSQAWHHLRGVPLPEG